ncbi:glycosyltransferase family 2 protein [Echinicola rosea]|uniref:Glycosyltransferase 2-like domain-containing protein n=1 Tax=Echinicola rosea TaxID=1807691 RepID=A0ABQ1VC43_9BACT|nr:glycosyltransferase family 2 protein [Echinicola rosea]GGF46959.1 hypothetical protein GCM10011339_39390 [Echinicola rosea]
MIIPVYNAAQFVKIAVASTVDLTEVGEVILIEDGSPDGALEICLQLAEHYDKVSLYQHPNGANKGAAASRNLGIEKATCDFVAFLDADDWYLPHRFKKDKEVFTFHPSTDVAYSCTVLEEDLYQPVVKRYGVRYDPKKQLKQEVTPLEFYEWKLMNKKVLFNTNSITLRREFLLKDKCFDTRLRLHQDSELWNRLMRRGDFQAAEWQNPVAVVRRHEGNRITHRSHTSALKMLAVMMDNIGFENLEKFERQYLFEQFLRNESKQYKNHWKRRLVYYLNRFVNRLWRDKFLKLKMKQYGID